MKYYLNKTIDRPFDEVVNRISEALGQQGFGILTDIDVSGTLKKKLEVDFPPYRILGACNPKMAHRALQVENKIGTMLPCNVIVRQRAEGGVEVAAVDPVASMQAIENPDLKVVADEVRSLLAAAIENL
jgi:uncharacterized protein (DUF302 family)